VIGRGSLLFRDLPRETEVYHELRSVVDNKAGVGYSPNTFLQLLTVCELRSSGWYAG
jgi:hypothetical protein